MDDAAGGLPDRGTSAKTDNALPPPIEATAEAALEASKVEAASASKRLMQAEQRAEQRANEQRNAEAANAARLAPLEIVIESGAAEAEGKDAEAKDADAVDGEDTEDYCRRMWQGQSNILVVVRVRPLLKHDRGFVHIVRVLERKVVVVLDPEEENKTKNVLRQNRSREKRYAFDYVFDERDTQSEVYARTTQFLIQGVLDGFNATVFAYGQTGAGKTHTMIGDRAQPGIMVLTLRDLFRNSDRAKAKQRLQIKVTVSFLEVYNENIRDLLTLDHLVDGDRVEFLDLREDPIKGPTVAGITEVEAFSAEEVMELLQRGNAKRSQHATAANESSSRSHAVLQITVSTREAAEGTAAHINIGKLSLVDLAGSERAANTKNTGDRLKEGANINRSLLTLGNCINALGEKASRGQFVPYRDSKLTRLLKDSLGGNCRTVMIANISASNASFEETLNTLKYANRAKNIKTHVQRNVLEVNHHVSEYVTLIENLRSEVTTLKQQLAHSGSTVGVGGHRASFDGPAPGAGSSPLRRAAPHVLARADAESLRLDESHGRDPGPSSGQQTPGTDKAALKEMKAWMQDNFRERMQLRRALIELEDQNVQNSIAIGKKQLIIANWNATRISTPKGIASERDRLSALISNSPADVQAAYGDVEQLRHAIDKNKSTKRRTTQRLRDNERGAEQCHADLRTDRRVTGEERRELLELMYKIGNLELGNMQLEQSQVIHDAVVRGKDLTIQKLQLQLAMRDKVIQKQRDLLKSHDISEQIGSVGLLLMADRTMAQNFDTLRESTPANALLDARQPRHRQAAAAAASPGRVVHVRERHHAYDQRQDPRPSFDLHDHREVKDHTRDAAPLHGAQAAAAAAEKVDARRQFWQPSPQRRRRPPDRDSSPLGIAGRGLNAEEKDDSDSGTQSLDDGLRRGRGSRPGDVAAGMLAAAGMPAAPALRPTSPASAHRDPTGLNGGGRRKRNGGGVTNESRIDEAPVRASSQRRDAESESDNDARQPLEVGRKDAVVPKLRRKRSSNHASGSHRGSEAHRSNRRSRAAGNPYEQKHEERRHRDGHPVKVHPDWNSLAGVLEEPRHARGNSPEEQSEEEGGLEVHGQSSSLRRPPPQQPRSFSNLRSKLANRQSSVGGLGLVEPPQGPSQPRGDHPLDAIDSLFVGLRQSAQQQG
ncbi:P-loop containing nucleoside triphosphate hydrolase protein [Pelagophyceae sp. CCMP2097]|nr:P-loop containing nucleoside triphosphate hydrolase protein [Pelagophyceae sp. CCMP2097]